VAKSQSSRARLFVALDLPEDTRARVGGLLSPREGLRAVTPHVTLAFLGWQAEEDVERIGALTGDALAGRGPIALIPKEVRAVPPRRPRLFALDLEDPDGACTELHAAVGHALAGAGLYEVEKRPFWPHVTLARIKRGHRVSSPPAGAPVPEAFEADRVVLYRSRLHPDGAVYDPQRAFTLKG
jgi:2'-5' RNA ligase